VFADVDKAREALLAAHDPQSQIQANGQLDGALGRLLAISENYPNLKANQNFLQLQDQLEGTENRIAVERRRYNETLQDYNTFIGQIPNNIWAHFAGFNPNTLISRPLRLRRRRRRCISKGDFARTCIHSGDTIG
jgi:LemA protein